MIPANDRILRCPHCGGKKAVLSLLSGNTFGAEVWSDTRRYYPMLPSVAPIQQCAECGKYYFADLAYTKEEAHTCNMDTGDLNFDQLLEARHQFFEEELDRLHRWVLDHEILMAYNDIFYRKKTGRNPNELEKAIRHETLNHLLETMDVIEDNADLFHAEVLRELGRYEESLVVLSKHDEPEDEWIVDAMRQHIWRLDSAPFKIVDNDNPVKV